MPKSGHFYLAHPRTSLNSNVLTAFRLLNALTVAGAVVLAKVMPLSAIATFASAGFSASDLAGKYLGDMAQTACHSSGDELSGLSPIKFRPIPAQWPA